jgi:peptidyl-dipeptidase Dcp
MRKTLLAVAVGAAVSLSACNDASNSSNTEKQTASAKSSQEATTMNPFFKPSPLQYHAPDFDAIQFKHFEPAFEKGMKEHMAEIEAIANNTEKPTFENTIVAMEKSGVILNRVSSVFLQPGVFKQ